MVAAPTESGQSTAAHAYVAGRETGCSRSRARVSWIPPGQAKTSPKAIAGRENSIGTKPVETLASKPNRITDRTTTPIGSHSESYFSVRLMRTELTTACRAPPLRDRPPHVAEEKTGPTAAGVSARFSVPCSFRSTFARHRIRHGIRHTEVLAGRRHCPSVANGRLRYMLIGWARVSKADGLIRIVGQVVERELRPQDRSECRRDAINRGRAVRERVAPTPAARAPPLRR